MEILIKDCCVVPMTGRGEGDGWFRGCVGISGNRIAMAQPGTECAGEFLASHPGARVIDGRGKVLMPGLINAHCHAPMTLMRGYADDIPLMRWLNDYIWPFEARLDRSDVELGARLGIAEMLLGGVTTFVDMYWYEASVARAVADTGIRAVVCPSFVDGNFARFEEDVRELSGWLRDCGRLTMMVAPHAPYSCSKEHLLRGGEIAREHGCGINIHIAETTDEQTEIERRTGVSPVRYIDSLGLIDGRTLAVHGVWLSDDDIEILRRRGATVVHNPQSNMKISSGAAPVAKLLERGVNVALGTDGPCSNNDLDMWEEMRSAAFLQKLSCGNPCVLPAFEVLRMATVNGARAIGLGDRLGRIEEGMLADVLLVDMRKPHLSPCNDVIANLVYCAKSSDVDCVVVDGRIVVENGRLCGTDVAALCEAVARRTGEIKARCADR